MAVPGRPGPVLVHTIALVDIDGGVIAELGSEIHEDGNAGEREDAEMADVLGRPACCERVVEDLVDPGASSVVVGAGGVAFAWKATQVDLNRVAV